MELSRLCDSVAGAQRGAQRADPGVQRCQPHSRSRSLREPPALPAVKRQQGSQYKQRAAFCARLLL